MVNYFNLTTLDPVYDTSYNRKGKDAFLGYMWLDLDNNRVVQITKDRLYYEGEPGLMEHKGTGTWTCPENGIYKIILVGGGAAGTSTSGGGYNLVDFGGNGQLIETVPRKNGGQGSMPAQGYGAGGAAGQPGADGCIVIIK